jgi:hypothetical protein
MYEISETRKEPEKKAEVVKKEGSLYLKNAS